MNTDLPFLVTYYIVRVFPIGIYDWRENQWRPGLFFLPPPSRPLYTESYLASHHPLDYCAAATPLLPPMVLEKVHSFSYPTSCRLT